MATFALIHGGGTTGSTFDRLASELRARGHQVDALDLPIVEPDGTLSRCAAFVAEAIGGEDDVIVVGHSFGGLVAPLVAELVHARLLVLMAAMIPAPGETASEWWSASGHSGATRDVDMSDIRATFLQDAPRELAGLELAKSRDHGDASMREPWPLDRWPEVPTRVLAFADDRFLPLDFQRTIVLERIGIETDSMPGSHTAYVSRPVEVADRLEQYVAEA